MIKLNIISLSKATGFSVGEVIGDMTLTIKHAESYFDRIRKNKPQTEILAVDDNSEYGLDNFGVFRKGGEFTYNGFGALVLKNKKQNSK
jgi:hypothetical protein